MSTAPSTVDDAYPSKYLKASDLPEEGTITFTIERIEIEEIGREKQVKPVVYFEEDNRGLVANKTNCNTIAKVTGSRVFDQWIGKRINLYRAEVDFQGEQVESIRVSLKMKPIVLSPKTVDDLDA
jgi:hypothetical protein